MDELTDIGEWISDNLPKIVFILIAVTAVWMSAGIIGSAIANEGNRIDSGIIVDKYMDPGGAYFVSDKTGGRMHSYPASYHFTIRGEKDGEEVEYTFEVSESEYGAHKIGDEYKG